MLNWANRFNIFCFLDSCGYSIRPGKYECLLAAGAKRNIISGTLADLDSFLKKGHWYFGHLSYSLCHSIHKLPSEKSDPLGFPPFHFFVPQVLLMIRNEDLEIHADDPDLIYRQITEQEVDSPAKGYGISFIPKLSRQEYIDIIEQLRQHILRGDCYEINFCQEFFSAGDEINPLKVYQDLTAVSPNPFSGFYRLEDRYVLCASPERFLFREGDRILSQPIKGTIGRDLADAEHDLRLKKELEESGKDQAENVMVVDLVRNDLSRICETNTVKVDELFGIYAYPQVYQMISTISGKLKTELLFSEILKATFPMGSMTGAPKFRVMQLIKQYEPSARGIFSGSLGYIDPEGDFDFNVIIRSIMYHSGTKYLSYQVGSGITYYSQAEKEWEECLLKAAAIKKVLTGGSAL